MLFKAHRFCTGADLYNPGAHILKTLTRDKETNRVRDLKPGDDTSPSVYDDIHHEGTSFFYGKLESLNSHIVKRAPDQSKIPRRLFYTETDALEDEILFPEEYSSDGKQVLAVEKLRRWEEEGFSVRKFVEGWWTDSDEDSSDNENEDEEDEEDDGQDDDEYLDDEDEEYDKGDERSLVKNGDQSLDMKNGSLEPLESLPGALEQLMAKLLPDFGKRQKKEPDMHEEFMEFLDREKARGKLTLLLSWLKVDLIPL
jgi:hypothetical protein